MTFKDMQPSRMEVIALSATKQAEPVNGLRVVNKAETWATLAVKPSDNKLRTVTLNFPPVSVSYEPGRFDTILIAGSTAISVDFIVHGYYDLENP